MLEVEEATLRGRLYDLSLGFPALVVPEESVRAAGAADYTSDARASGRLAEDGGAKVSSGAVVHGELMAFDDPEDRLPAIDALEGYRPGAQGFYKRVLVPVEPSGANATVLAWAYAVESASGVYLPGGRWPEG